MYQLFHGTPHDNGGGLVLPDYRRIHDGLKVSLDKVLSYRRSNPIALNSSHALIRLLQNLNISLGNPVDIYIDKVSDEALNLAMSMKMTSMLYTGRLFKEGVFYGKTGGGESGIQEIIIANVDPFDVNDFRVNWRDYQSIRVLQHPQTDLWLNVPDGRSAKAGAGIAVVTVNVPMLAAQYRQWRYERREVEARESPRTVGQFLAEVPLPNMLYSHLDVALFNRMVHTYFGVAMIEADSEHSFAMTRWDAPVDAMLGKFLDVVPQRKWDFDTILSHFPTVGSPDYHSVLKLPDMAYSRQMQWAVLLARLPLITFLVQVNRHYENHRNTMNLARIRHSLRFMENNGTLRSALSLNQYDDVMATIEDAILPYL